jgi:hypothetical protein
MKQSQRISSEAGNKEVFEGLWRKSISKTMMHRDKSNERLRFHQALLWLVL